MTEKSTRLSLATEANATRAPLRHTNKANIQSKRSVPHTERRTSSAQNRSRDDASAADWSTNTAQRRNVADAGPPLLNLC